MRMETMQFTKRAAHVQKRLKSLQRRSVTINDVTKLSLEPLLQCGAQILTLPIGL